MILKLLWKFIYRSRKLRLRVYRVVEERNRIIVWSLVYEDIQCKQFICNFSFSEQAASTSRQLTDVNAARQAMMGLEDVILLMDRDRWKREGADSIEGAIDKARAVAKERYAGKAKSASIRVPLMKRRRGKLSAYAKVKQNPTEDTWLASPRISHGFTRLAGLPRQPRIAWVPVEPTPSGCSCEILLVDGREEHEVP